MEQPEQVNMLDFFNYENLGADEQHKLHNILHGPSSQKREPELPWETPIESPSSSDSANFPENVNAAQSEQITQSGEGDVHVAEQEQPQVSVMHPSPFRPDVINTNIQGSETGMFSQGSETGMFSPGIPAGMVPMPMVVDHAGHVQYFTPYPQYMMSMPPPAGATRPDNYMMGNMVPMAPPGMGPHGGPQMTMQPVHNPYPVETAPQIKEEATYETKPATGTPVDKSGQGAPPRERRNKKKRPPDYYKRLEEKAKEVVAEIVPAPIENKKPIIPVSIAVSEETPRNPASNEQYTHSLAPQNNVEISFNFEPTKESSPSSDTSDLPVQIMHSDQQVAYTSINTAQNNVINQTPSVPRIQSLPLAMNTGESSKNVDICNIVSFGTVGVVSPEKQVLGKESPVQKDNNTKQTKEGCDKVSPSKEIINQNALDKCDSTAQVVNQINIDNTKTTSKSSEPNQIDKPATVDSTEDPKPVITAPVITAPVITAPVITAPVLDSPTSPPNAQEKPKVASWASLLHGTSTANSATVVYDTTPNSSGAKSEERKDASSGVKQASTSPLNVVVPTAEDKNARELGELIQSYTPKYSPVSLLPRGLHNSNNWCYINATLQALLACPAFYHLMKALPDYPALERGPSSTPVIDAMCEFINEFDERPIQKLDGKALNAKGTLKQDVPTGSTFEPKGIFRMLNLIKYDSTFKLGKQEDAEEFLSCVLNLLHEEMVAAVKLVEEDKQKGEVIPSSNGDCSPDGSTKPVKEEEEEEDEGQWEQVGPRNKSVITRTGDFDASPVSSIFRGQLRSVLHKPGAKESATLEPFFTLQLDIQNEAIWSVNDALQGFVSRETLQGYTCMKKGVEVDATRRIFLEELPPVLILHLKCFVYDKNGGCQKVIKQIEFGTDLELSKDLLAPNIRSKTPPHMRKYKLFAVVNHLGARAIGGHYVADVYHPGINGWLRCDDGFVRSTSPASVTKFVMPKVPYLLYYRRNDLT